MTICPNCSHEFREEEIITFDVYNEWNDYVHKYMHNASKFPMGTKTSIQSGSRVLAEWDGFEYGFVSEARHNKLKRMTYMVGDRI